MRILLVDDFEPWRRFLCAHLECEPRWRVICEAQDGVEAVQRSKELQPDLVLLDIGMPRMNGLQAAQEIRNVAPKAKILFLSENSSPEIVRESLRAGGRGYVRKSDAGRDLLTAMQAVLANQQFVGEGLIPDSGSGSLAN